MTDFLGYLYTILEDLGDILFYVTAIPTVGKFLGSGSRLN